MSSPDALAYEEVFVHAAHTVWVTRICQLCPCIIFCYDYLLTLDREVEFIWRRPMRSSNVLYIIVRFGGGALMFLTTSGRHYCINLESSLTNIPSIYEFSHFKRVLFILPKSSRVAQFLRSLGSSTHTAAPSVRSIPSVSSSSNCDGGRIYGGSYRHVYVFRNRHGRDYQYK